MVKFAYFIHFVQQLLGSDISALIQDRLNAIRYYDQMKLTLLCLNTISDAGPLRNNKIHIDAGFVDKVKHAGCFSNQDTLCLSHHTAVYQADYATDRYATAKIASFTKMRNYVDRFRKILGQPLQTEADRQTVKNDVEFLYRDLVRERLTPEADMLMTDVLFYRNNFRELSNERCETIRSAMQRDDNMQKADQKNQREMFGSLIQDANVKIILGGHIHEINLRDDVHCYEGPLFYDDAAQKYLYGILTMNQTAQTHDWMGRETTSGGSVPIPGGAKYYVPTQTIDKTKL